MTTYIEHYHDWLRDAHAMEKQAQKMLTSMSDRIEHYPEVKQRLGQHLTETQHQIKLLDEIIERNNISHSVVKDTVSKMTALGQAVGGMLASDEIVKGSISGYVFEQFEVACYTALIAAAKKAGDTQSVPILEGILKQEQTMAEWAITHLPEVTDEFLQRSATPDTKARI